MGILYIVATPIGNLEDITLRAIRTLFETEYIICEDTRRTGLLLSLLEKKYPQLLFLVSQKIIHQFISYYDDIELERIPEILEIIRSGHTVALVSDAGTPAISDPGFKLIRECRKEGIRVESIPGPSSVISSLVVSGLPTDKFFFVGYPPRKPGNRMKFFEGIRDALAATRTTIIFFEAPHRLSKTLTDFQTVFGDQEIVVTKELTKVHESVRREKVSVILEQFKKKGARGEFVILFHPEE